MKLAETATKLLFVTLLGASAGLGGAQGADEARRSGPGYDSYRQVVERTAAMVRDTGAARLASQHGLQILDLTWEDTGRYKQSSVGPNISDMTIQVQLMDPRTEEFSLHLMPVIRYPNFADRSADVPLERFFVRVGNEKVTSLRRVNLRELLGNLRDYLHDSRSWAGGRGSLLKEAGWFSKGETHALVSAQACFLPVPRDGKAEFNPVLFNYQSVADDPAVLAIVATREGTSCTIIDNTRDAFQAGNTWGQRLFFNQDGQRASFSGERLSDFQNDEPRPFDQGRESVEIVPDRTAGLNLVLLIQVPLKQKNAPRRGQPAPMAAGAMEMSDMAKRSSDVEEAVIGHGRVEGPFTEIDGQAIERDPRFPIRVTVQFYKATSNGALDQRDMADIKREIERVYSDADYVGSLVVDGPTNRPTEPQTGPQGPKTEPPGWWDDFWLSYERRTHISREQALELLRKSRGPTWMPQSEAELDTAVRDLSGK